MSRSISLTLVFVGVCVLPACARKLDDQHCPCTDGWTCCMSQNRCLPAGVPDSCPGDDPTPVVLPEEVCTVDGWCGATQPMTSVWGAADDDIWIVVNDLGGAGTGRPIHFDGAKWSTMTFGSSDAQVGSITAIWGTARSDVFAASDNAIVHFDGSSWRQETGATGNWVALGGTSATDVWAVGATLIAETIGRIAHYDGTLWTQQAVPDLSMSTDDPLLAFAGVWAASSTDAWAVGAAGTILRWDGSHWNARPASIDGAPVTQDLLGVWGSSDKDVWIVGRSATLLHFDGLAWSRPNIDVDLGGLGATGSFRAVRGTGRDDVWFAGDGGVLIHWDGSHWSAAPSGTTRQLNALWKSPRGDLWTVGDDATVVHGRGDAWIATPPPPFKGLPVTSIRGNSQSDIWIAGSGLVRHWDGQSWLACDAQDGWHFEKIQMMGPHDALMVGSGVGMREYALVDGACRVTGSGSGTTMDMHDIWANAPNDIWAGGAQGTVQHFDGATWSDVAVPTTADIVSVWGSPTDVLGEPIYLWALTGGDTAIRWDGTSWTVLSPLTGVNPGRPGLSWTMIAGTSPYDTTLFGVDVLVPGESIIEPISRHWNGTSWSRTVPDDDAFGGGNDRWDGVGGLWVGGRTAFRNGSLGWTAEYTGDPAEVIGIWGGVDTVWVLGRDGALMHHSTLD